MINSISVCEEALRWIDVPYVHQGRSRSGVDCIGLIIAVSQSLNLLRSDFNPPRNYSRLPEDFLLLKEFARECIALSEPAPGCVLLIKWHEKDPPGHCALLTNRGTMIHAYGNVKKVTEHGFRGHWPKRVHSIWALPGVSYE